MIFITTLCLVAVLSAVWFVLNANQETIEANRLLHNYVSWLNVAESQLEDAKHELKTAYKVIDKYQDQINKLSDQLAALEYPQLQTENNFGTPVLDDEKELSILSWSPQHAGDSQTATEIPSYTGADSNSAEAYGDLYEDGVDEY